MDNKPSEKAEALAKQLQEKLRRERPRWLRWVPLLAVFLLGTLAVWAWLVFNPAPDPPPLTLTALDVLTVAGESATLRAYFDPVHAAETPAALPGLEVLFIPDPAKGGADGQRKVSSDDHGLATVLLDPGPPAKTEYQVRQFSLAKKTTLTGSAQIHVLPKDAALLLVDAEETLADVDAALWPKTNPQNIAVRTGAADALRAVQAAKSYSIVYLATAQDAAKEYRRVRGWIANHANDAKGLPDGPVLGRLRYDSASARDTRHALLSDLRQRFTGPMAAVVRTAEAAEQCLTLGIRAVAMGGGDFPERVTRIKGWDELPRALAP